MLDIAGSHTRTTSSMLHVPLLVVISATIDVVLCGAYFLNSYFGPISSKLTHLLDLNGEDSLAAWYSSVKFFTIFLLGLIFVFNSREKTGISIAILFFPMIFLLMSIDESVQIHEWLGHRLDVMLLGVSGDDRIFNETGTWMFVIGIPFLGVFLVWANSIKRHAFIKGPSFTKLVAGTLILLSGAIGVETISNFTEETFYVAQVIAEEGLEMIGATIVLWSAYELAVEHLPKIKPIG